MAVGAHPISMCKPLTWRGRCPTCVSQLLEASMVGLASLWITLAPNQLQNARGVKSRAGVWIIGAITVNEGEKREMAYDSTHLGLWDCSKPKACFGYLRPCV